MANFKFGYLFKKKYTIYKNEEYEIFEFIDIIAGIAFTNIDKNNRCNILTGKYAGMYASVIDKNKNEEELVFIDMDLSYAIEKNDNNVEFESIRKKIISSTAKYYLRDNDGVSLKKLVNEKLIEQLENENKRETDFDENEFQNESDISSMYSTIKKLLFHRTNK